MMPFDLLRQIVLMGLLAVAVCFELDRSSAWTTLEKLGVFVDRSPAPEVTAISVLWLYMVAFQ